MNGLMIFENKQVEIFNLNVKVLFNPKDVAQCLEIKNIKYEVREDEIYLPEFYKTILIDSLMSISLDFKDIKDIDFYNDLVKKIKSGIKEIKLRYFPIEGMFYLIFTGILYWIKTDFLVNFLK